MENYLIKFLETNINFLRIYVSPSLNNLSNADLKVNVNNVAFTDYYSELIADSEYKITPKNPFSIYDEVSIFIKNDTKGIISNSIVVCLCKIFHDGEEIINYTIPDLESGIYRIITESLNEVDFNISTDDITICNGISSLSSFSSESYDPTNKKLPLNITLLDSKGNKAPKGNYIIKFKYEKI